MKNAVITPGGKKHSFHEGLYTLWLHTDHLALCAHRMRVHNIVDRRSFICLHMFVLSPRVLLAMMEWRTTKNETTTTATTENHHRKHLLTGWEWVPLQNGEITAMPPPRQTQRRDWETTKPRDNWRRGGNEEAKQTKKGPKRRRLTSLGLLVSVS